MFRRFYHMFFILALIIGIIIFAVYRRHVKKEQKIEAQELELHKREVEAEGLFVKDISDMLDDFASPAYIEYYTHICNLNWTASGKHSKLETYDELIKQIPLLKIRFATALDELVAISEDNTVFFYDEDVRENLRQKYVFNSPSPDHRAIEKKISGDIIKTLPLLAEYLDVYRILHEEIYEEMSNLTFFANELFGILQDSTKEKSEEDQKIWDACVEYLQSAYNTAIKNQWGDFIEEHPYYNTSVYKKKYIDISEKQSGLYYRWIELWHDNLQKVLSPYLSAWLDLNKFFDYLAEHKYRDFAEKLHPSCPHALFFKAIPYDDMKSSLFMDYENRTKEECYRLLELYVSGKLKGEYAKLTEKYMLERNTSNDK